MANITARIASGTTARTTSGTTARTATHTTAAPTRRPQPDQLAGERVAFQAAAARLDGRLTQSPLSRALGGPLDLHLF